MNTKNLREYQRNTLVILILGFLCTMTYWNALQNDFFHDDYKLIHDNTALRHAQPLAFHFTTNQSAGFYRPVSSIVLFILYQIFGSHPLGYHACNLIFFYISCLLIFFLLNRLSKNFQVSFIASLLFCVHPINAVVMNFIVTNSFIFLGIFMMLCLMTLLAHQQNGRRVYYWLSLLFFSLSLLCHEEAIMYWAYPFITAYFFSKRTFKESMVIALPFLVISSGYLVFRMQVASLKSSVISGFLHAGLNLFNHGMIVIDLVRWYIEKLFDPRGIIFVWNITGITRMALLKDAIFVILFIVLAVFVIKRWKKGLKSFSLAWFLTGLVPVCLGCFTYRFLGFMIEPHWFFFSSIGFYFLLSMGLCHIKTFVRINLWVTLIIVIVLYFASYTRQYNRLWKTPAKYYQYVLTVSENNNWALFGMARHYMKEGGPEKARELFKRTIVGMSIDWQVYYNLGLIDCNQEKYKEAMEKFKQALSLKPDSATTYNNIGTVFLDMGNNQEALRNFKRAMILDPDLIEPQLNLASICRFQKNNTAAIKLYEQILRIDPCEKSSLRALIELYSDNGARKKALETGRKILEKNCDETVFVESGDFFAQRQYTDMAITLYLRALQKNPSYADVYLELGKIYGNQEKFKEAIIFWQEGLRVAPRDGRFIECIKKTQEIIRAKSPGGSISRRIP